MAAQRGKGRPKVPPSKRRRHSIHVLLRHAEFKAIKKEAEADDLTASTWARRVLLREIGWREE